MFPRESVTLDILRKEKVEACIFSITSYFFSTRDLHTSYEKRMASYFDLAAAIAQINCVCSQILGLSVLLDTDRTFHGYLLPCVNTNNIGLT
jgi:hypothetical protein